MRLNVCAECHPVCAVDLLVPFLKGYTNENVKAQKAFI